MTRAARAAHDAAAAPGPERSLARLVEGSARLLGGRGAPAAELLEEGAQSAVFDAPLVRSLCLAELAILALQHGEREDAATLVSRARAALERDRGAAHPLGALVLAVSALAHAHGGRPDRARADGEQAARGLAALPDPPPWYAALTRVVLARVHLKLTDASEARRLLSEAARLRRQVPGAVALEAWIDHAWGLADDQAAAPVRGSATLTLAELRVLRLLPSHLSFREIAARLHVSANTVKTQAHAVYRKLDASSRSQAVEQAATLGLVQL